MAWLTAMVQEVSFIHENTERSHASGGFSLFGTSVRVLGLDDLVDDSPRRDVLGRLLLHDLVGEVVRPRPEVVSSRRDVHGRVRERDLGLGGVDDGSDLLSGTPLSAIFWSRAEFKVPGDLERGERAA